jgi:hypothetical protein
MPISSSIVEQVSYVKFALLIGSLRIRLPVAAKIALVTAGAIAGTQASPAPPGLSELGTK